jgi:hypothetical protein
MGGQRCRACGAALQRGEASCPHCGARVEPVVSRLWVFAFFVMGVVIGLLILVLQQGGPGSISSSEAEVPVTLSEPATKKVSAKVKAKPKVKAASRKSPAPVPHSEVEAPPPPAEAVVEPIECDRAEARAVRDKARTLALISNKGDELILQLNENWAYYSAGLQRSFAATFADADRCLSGRARTMRFFFRGEEVAVVTKSGAIEMR